MKTHKQFSLLQTRIDAVTLADVIAHITHSLKHRLKTILFPMNIHILIELANTPAFKQIYERSAHIIFCDGVPLVWLSHIYRVPLPERVSGTDVVDYLLTNHSRIFLLGSSERVLARMRGKYSSICGIYSPPYSETWSNKENQKIIRLIRQAKTQILLVGVGPLKQERWIVEHFAKTGALLAAPVGSAFDILSGVKPRAPMFVQHMGLEWAWRIMLEPKRLTWRYAMDALLLIKLAYLQAVQSFHTKKGQRR